MHFVSKVINFISVKQTMHFQNFIKNKGEEMKEKPTTILITSERLTICIPGLSAISWLNES